jgi:hypothetical protein
VLRLTSLFGDNCAELFEGFEGVRAAERWEAATDEDSGPTLDLGLLFCDVVIENRRNHDPLDEIESLLGSSPVS